MVNWRFYVLSGGELPALTLIDSVAPVYTGSSPGRNISNPGRLLMGCWIVRTIYAPCMKLLRRGDGYRQYCCQGNHAEIRRWRFETVAGAGARQKT